MVKAHPSGTDAGLKMSDLCGHVLLWHVGRSRKGSISFKGQTRAGTIVPCDTWRLDLRGETIEHLGVIRVVQDVLTEHLTDEGAGAWLTTRVIKPDRAYLLEALTDEEQAVADRLTANVPDGPGPASLGLGAGTPDEDYGTDDESSTGAVDPDDDEPF